MKAIAAPHERGNRRIVMACEFDGNPDLEAKA
jgi:hypothetical protein